MSSQVLSPFPYFTTRDGSRPLNLGYIYIGEPNKDPQAFPQAAFWDAALTIPAAQPIRTDGGYIVNGGDPATLYTAGAFSFRSRVNSGGSPGTVAFYRPNVPNTDALRDELAAASGSGLVGFLQAGAGANPRTVQAVLRDSVRVTDFMGVLTTTAAIQAAFDAVGDNGEVIFPRGTYTTTAEITIPHANVSIKGDRAKLVGTGTFKSFFNLSGSSGVTVEGISFDQGKTSLSTYNSYPDVVRGALWAEGHGDITVKNCDFTNLYSVACYFKQGTGRGLITGCTFSSPAQTQMLRLEHILLQTSGTHWTIGANLFNNVAPATPSVGVCALFAGGITGSVDFSHNTVLNAGRDNTGGHRLGSVDAYGDVLRLTVAHNRLLGCMAEVIRVNTVSGGIITGNDIAMAATAETGRAMISVESTAQYFGTGVLGCDDIQITGNIFRDPSNRALEAVALGAYDWGSPLLNIIISHNTQQSGTGSIRMGGPFYGVSIIDNIDTGNIIVLPAPGGITVGTVAGTEANGTFDKLVIHNNTITDNSGANANGIQVALDTLTTALVGGASVESNRLRANPASTAAGISVKLRSTTLANSRALVARNEVQGYTTAYDYEYIGDLEHTDNRGIGATTDVSFGSLTNITRHGNKYASGPTQGVATLVAGAVTVATGAVRTGDNVNIELSRVTISGTPGILSVGTVTAGTSFVINSNQATDVGQIHWRLNP